jgi:phytoene synthase
MAVALVESYRECAQIARREAKNFYWSFVTLPREKRMAMCAIYAFMRKSDDIADGAANPEDAAEQLAQWRKQIHAALAENDAASDKILPALADTVRKFSIPHRHFDELLDGTVMDQNVTRYETFQDLYKYCYHVASVVGLVVLPVLGYSDKRALEHGEACGIAFQLTNILRDVKEDAAMGRVYLPQEDLKKFGVGEEQIFRNEYTPQFVELMNFEAARASEYYQRARPLLGLVTRESRATLAVMMDIYGGLLEKLRREKFRVFDGKISLSAPKKVAIVMKNSVRYGLFGRSA